jgi:glycosyltransferase involved in cell wall biosynthesis
MAERACAASIVVPAYNVVDYVEEALASVAAQTHRALEIIAVDDGSTDGTGALLDRLRLEKAGVWPPLTVIHQKNAGPSAARNRAMRSARGTLIGFLDADDLWHPEKLARHLAVLEAHAETDLTFSWFRSVDVHGRATGWIGRPTALSFRDVVCENGIVTSLVVARRDALERAGAFDEALRSHVDFDLWLRVANLQAGNFRCIPEVLVDLRTRPEQITSDWRRMAHNWERVIGNARRLQPDVVAAVEPEARARQGLFLAKCAYRAGDARDARALLRAAWAAHPVAVAWHRQGWGVTAAVTLASLPWSVRKPLFQAIRWCRRKSASSRPVHTRTVR